MENFGLWIERKKVSLKYCKATLENNSQHPMHSLRKEIREEIHKNSIYLGSGSLQVGRN